MRWTIVEPAGETWAKKPSWTIRRAYLVAAAPSGRRARSRCSPWRTRWRVSRHSVAGRAGTAVLAGRAGAGARAVGQAQRRVTDGDGVLGGRREAGALAGGGGGGGGGAHRHDGSGDRGQREAQSGHGDSERTSEEREQSRPGGQRRPSL